jgi:hypothetical protein
MTISKPAARPTKSSGQAHPTVSSGQARPTVSSGQARPTVIRASPSDSVIRAGTPDQAIRSSLPYALIQMVNCPLRTLTKHRMLFNSFNDTLHELLLVDTPWPITANNTKKHSY